MAADSLVELDDFGSLVDLAVQRILVSDEVAATKFRCEQPTGSRRCAAACERCVSPWPPCTISTHCTAARSSPRPSGPARPSEPSAAPVARSRGGCRSHVRAPREGAPVSVETAPSHLRFFSSHLGFFSSRSVGKKRHDPRDESADHGSGHVAPELFGTARRATDPRRPTPRTSRASRPHSAGSLRSACGGRRAAPG
jgi:hypothetical protein